MANKIFQSDGLIPEYYMREILQEAMVPSKDWVEPVWLTRDDFLDVYSDMRRHLGQAKAEALINELGILKTHCSSECSIQEAAMVHESWAR